MHRTLQDFLRALESAGELHRIAARVSPLLEITEIVQRQNVAPCRGQSPYAQDFDPAHANSGGAALLFEHVEGCDFPLAINFYGSYRRMEMALGVEREGGFQRIAQRLESLTRPQPPRSLREMLRKGRELLPLLRIPPRLVRSGVCQDVVRLTSRGEVDLLRMPLLRCWPFDGDPRMVGIPCSPEEAGTASGGGRFITFAGMHTVAFEDRDEAKPASHNIGMYRAQLIDRTRLAMHWHMHHDGAAHWRSWKRGAPGRPMPIAICLGGESVLPYAATAPLPPGMSELLLAGLLNGHGIPLVRCTTIPLRVPANSEIVIEGWVSTECGGINYDPRSGEPLGPGAVFEGPFGDHTGYYSMPDRYPIVEVTAVTHRRDAVFPAIVVGPPPQEDYYLGKATERIFLPLLRTIILDIADYHLPLFGCFHNCAFVQIRKSYPLHGRRVMHAIWGAGQMSWTKLIIVVDDDVNVHDELAVMRSLFERCDFARDLEMVNGPLDILDHAAPRLGAGHKLGLDATRKVPGEEVNGIPVRAQEKSHSPTPRGGHSWSSGNVAAPDFGGGRCAFIAVERRAAGAGIDAIESLWNRVPEGCADFVVAVDSSVDVRDWQQVMFHLCANFDPGRDMIRRGTRLGLDATRKIPGAGLGLGPGAGAAGDDRHGQPVRDFPPLIEMDEATRSLVDRRWDEYGLARERPPRS
jgi:4-hydroxy-3-polyprenylbenzoate decarboxylase